jgi:hypothetical protein
MLVVRAPILHRATILDLRPTQVLRDAGCAAVLRDAAYSSNSRGWHRWSDHGALC